MAGRGLSEEGAMDSNVILPQLPTYVGSPTLAGLLSVLVTVCLPILAALFMRSGWTAMRKGLVLLAVAAVKGFAEAWIAALADHVAFNVVTTLYSVGVQFVIAVAMYFGIWRNTPLQQSAISGGVIKTAGGKPA